MKAHFCRDKRAIAPQYDRTPGQGSPFVVRAAELRFVSFVVFGNAASDFPSKGLPTRNFAVFTGDLAVEGQAGKKSRRPPVMLTRDSA